MDTQSESKVTHLAPIVDSSLHDGSIASPSHDVRIIGWLRSRWLDAAAYFTGRTKIKLPDVESVMTLLSFPRTRPVGQSREKDGDVKVTPPFLHDTIPAGSERLGTQETVSDSNLIMISPLAIQKGTKAVLTALVYAAIDLAARPEQFNDKTSGAPRFRKRTKAYNSLVKALSLSTHAPNYDMETSAVAAWAEERAGRVGDPPEFIVEVAKTMQPTTKREAKNKAVGCPRDHVKSIIAYPEALAANPLACVACVQEEMNTQGLDAESQAVVLGFLTGAALAIKEQKTEETSATAPETPAEAPAARAANPKRGSRRATSHK